MLLILLQSEICPLRSAHVFRLCAVNAFCSEAPMLMIYITALEAEVFAG